MTYDIKKEYDLWLQEEAVEVLVFQILLHLLLINYWHEESESNRNNWASEITGFKLQLNNKLTTNLKNHVLNRLDDLYQMARKVAIYKTQNSVKSDRCAAPSVSLSFRTYL